MGAKIAVIGSILALACVAGFFAFQTKTLTVDDLAALPSESHASTTDPTSTPTDPPAPVALVYEPIDPAAYAAKMLAIANLPPRRVTSSTATSSIASSTATSTAPRITGPWPVKNAPYPNAGALLPFHRIVAYYGNLYSRQMGVLGEYPEDQMLAMLASTTAMWQAADPSTPVVPALDYIVVAAQATAQPDKTYRLRMPDGQIDKVLAMAAKVNGVVFLDVQVGLSSVEKEIPVLEPYLKLPQVHLSLDPEFDMPNGEPPGTVIGTMDASDINWAAQYLAGLVQKYNLPPKMLVIHRFTEDMVTNYRQIKPLPEVQIIMDMDGFGFPAKKINTYQRVIVPEPVQFTGFKLFYKNDIKGPQGHLMTPQEVLKLSPQPSYIQYQ